MPRGRPRRRCSYRPSGCACRHQAPLFFPDELFDSPTTFTSYTDLVIVVYGFTGLCGYPIYSLWSPSSLAIRTNSALSCIGIPLSFLRSYNSISS